MKLLLDDEVSILEVLKVQALASVDADHSVLN